MDGEAEVSARFTILSLGNGRYIGGGMKAVPNAKPDDGLLDLVLVRPVKKWQIGALLALYVPGLYVKTPLAKVRRVRTLEIACPGMTVNLDGELKPAIARDLKFFPQRCACACPDWRRRGALRNDAGFWGPLLRLLFAQLRAFTAKTPGVFPHPHTLFDRGPSDFPDPV